MDLDELVFHPWSEQGPRSVPTFVGGSGSHVVDADGRPYVDFSSQLVFTNLGHQHPRIVAAIKEQADRLCALAPAHASDVRGEAARLIIEVAPDGLGHVLFTTGGTEAIEHAVRMARLYTGRPKVLAAYRSYHGSTHASIHLTGDPRRFASDTGAAGAVHFFGPFMYRSVFGSRTTEEECERALAHLEQVILLEGPSTISALVLESVIGSSGSSSRRPVTCAGSVTCARATASSTSPTRCWSASAAPEPGSESTTTTLSPICWSSRRASTLDPCRWVACWSATRSTRH